MKPHGNVVILLLLTVVILCGAQQLSLIERSPIQGLTMGAHEARLAVDGNLATYALSSSPMVSSNMAWWIINLGGNYPIKSIGVTNPYNFDSGVDYSLENFDIYVVTSSNSYQQCYRYISPPFSYGETKTFPCTNGPLYGVSIYFKKLAGGLRNELAMAEVTVYTGPTQNNSNGTNPGNSQAIFAITAIQSADLALFRPGLAIDGDLSTYSVALTRGVNAYPWWQADLGANFAIIQVVLIAGPDLTSAQYLQSVLILVSTIGYSDDPTFSRGVTCTSRSSSVLINRSTSFAFVCATTPSGRYLIVRRLIDNTYRTDILSIAEVQVRGYRV